jgi:hypothetical protein
MAATAHTLRRSTIAVPRLSWYVTLTAAVRRARIRSQLGTSPATQIGRHTGARC